MGYTTSFTGKLSFDKPVDEKTAAYLTAFFKTRHVIRDTNTLSMILKSNHINLEDVTPVMSGIQSVGEQGKFFIKPFDNNKVPYPDISVINDNEPPADCPSLWCDFAISQKENSLYMLDGKNYAYIKWLKWLINYIIAPAGYKLNGRIEYDGEDWNDHGFIEVTDNQIRTWEAIETTAT